MECYSRLVPCYSDMDVALFPADQTKYLAVLIGDSQVVIPYKKNAIRKDSWVKVRLGDAKSHRRVTPSIKFSGTVIIYTPGVERLTVKVTCRAQEHNTMAQARAQVHTARFFQKCCVFTHSTTDKYVNTIFPSKYK